MIWGYPYFLETPMSVSFQKKDEFFFMLTSMCQCLNRGRRVTSCINPHTVGAQPTDFPWIYSIPYTKLPHKSVIFGKGREILMNFATSQLTSLPAVNGSSRSWNNKEFPIQNHLFIRVGSIQGRRWDPMRLIQIRLSSPNYLLQKIYVSSKPWGGYIHSKPPHISVAWWVSRKVKLKKIVFH